MEFFSAFYLCTLGMVYIDGYCIDQYEASLDDLGYSQSVADAVPVTYMSGLQADLACKRSGKRLCTIHEWEKACTNSFTTEYPYGNFYAVDVCNDDQLHPMALLFGVKPSYSYKELLDVRASTMFTAKTGFYSECKTNLHVYDMHGNVNEWTSDGILKGGYYSDAKTNGRGCFNRTRHLMHYKDYSTGYRCCMDSTF